MFLEITGAQGICLPVYYPVLELTSLFWVHRIPWHLAVLGTGLYNPIECPREARAYFSLRRAASLHCARPGYGTRTHAASRSRM